ncbi:hypothetical protein BJ742DRAFT_381724 [Cladochytrium replicatum]|nr:hypothetical protein BJ742DRAFT_381724 [Cladochytrium replicatum]
MSETHLILVIELNKSVHKNQMSIKGLGLSVCLANDVAVRANLAKWSPTRWCNSTCRAQTAAAQALQSSFNAAPVLHTKCEHVSTGAPVGRNGAGNGAGNGASTLNRHVEVIGRFAGYISTKITPCESSENCARVFAIEQELLGGEDGVCDNVHAHDSGGSISRRRKVGFVSAAAILGVGGNSIATCTNFAVVVSPKVTVFLEKVMHRVGVEGVDRC